MEKMENVLSLALETPLEERKKTLDLNVGYEEENDTWEVVVKYNGSLDELRRFGVETEELIAGYGILTVPVSLLGFVAKRPEIEYMEMPKRLYFSLERGKEASCILQASLREPYLTGKGVLVAIIDSGLDINSLYFRNSDGTSRIVE